MHASFRGNLELMRVLLAAGADVSARDFQQRTPLFYATHGGHNNAIQLLFQSGTHWRLGERVWQTQETVHVRYSLVASGDTQGFGVGLFQCCILKNRLCESSEGAEPIQSRVPTLFKRGPVEESGGRLAIGFQAQR